MTDARMPERWLSDRRLLRLSDAAYRLHLTGLLWSVANRTDGEIPEEDLPLLTRVDAGRTDELERAQLWQRTADGWRLVDFEATQTSAHELAVLENNRRREREKKARQRARARDTNRDDPEGLSPGTALGQDRQDRPGRDRKTSATLCETCDGEMSADAVAAGWTSHPACDQPAWPPVRQVSA